MHGPGGCLLDRLGAGFPGADAYRRGELGHEYLAVAGAAGARDVGDRLDHLVDDGVLDGELDPGFRLQVDAMRGAPVAFDVPELTAETQNLGHGQALNPDVRNGLPQVIQLEGLDDCGDQLHRRLLRTRHTPETQKCTIHATPGS